MFLSGLKRLLALAIFLMLSSSVIADEWDYRSQSKINWRDYSDKVFQEAKKQNKPVYVFVYAEWCSWCKKFEVETLEKKEVRDLLENGFISVAMDYDLEQENARGMGAKLVPTSMVLTPDGDRLLLFFGLLKKEEFIEALKITSRRWRKGEHSQQQYGDESTCCKLEEKK